MSGMNVSDTTRCENCGDEFANHNYVANSITKYRCPRPRVESCYGFFSGGDPRSFCPDPECCTLQEIKNHKAACKLADEMESRGEVPDWDCPSGWGQRGETVVHVLRAPFGLGITTIEIEQFFEAADEYRDSDDDDGE